MRTLLTLFILFFTTPILGQTISRDTSFKQIDTRIKLSKIRLKEHADSVKRYDTLNGFNTQICFLIDMSIPSGKNRFFVYNLKNNNIEISGLVSHGTGSEMYNFYDSLKFSNELNSYATSIGKYRIGKSYIGGYGLSYRLYGLDATNSNALIRDVVLHSHFYVPDIEVYPRHIFLSSGCPTVSPALLKKLSKYIRASNKPILLWIYK